jgi:hypothetical protein
VRIVVDRLWDGSPAAPEERVDLELRAAADGDLHIAVDAPFHGDPPPPSPPGPTPGLWNHEVVELFLYGDADRYLEVELGPHGHHLVLALHGARNVVRQGLAIDFRRALAGARWRGDAVVPAALLPGRPARCNAHAIHGVAAARRYLSAIAAGGARPDFHRPEASAALEPALLAALLRARRQPT